MYRSNDRPDIGRATGSMRNELPEIPRSEELLLDVDAVARALKAPLPARFGPEAASGMRPKYRLEDRLNGAGVVGSIVPPTEFHLNLMRPTLAPKRKSPVPTLVGIALVLLTSITGTVVYRDMMRAAAPAESSR